MDFAKDWNGKDSMLLAAAAGATDADLKETKKILDRGGRETNPLLGERPSGSDLDKAAIVQLGLTTGLASALPVKYRRAVLGAYTGWEAGLAHKNSKANPEAKRTDYLHSSLEGPLMMAALGALAGYGLDSLGDDGFKLGAKLEKEVKGDMMLYLTGEMSF